MTRKATYLAALCGLALCGERASCDSLIVEVINPSPFDFQGSATVGYAFRTTDTPIAVTALGMWDDQGDGFPDPVDVALWTLNGDLLRSVTLPAGEVAPLVGEFRYDQTNFPPVRLEADTVYVIGGYRLAGVPYSTVATAQVDFLVDANFDIVEERYSSSLGGEPTIEFPDFDDDRDQAAIGPNLLFREVPEPSAIWIAMAFALSAITGGRWPLSRAPMRPRR